MPAAWGSFYSPWRNFEQWLNSPEGSVFVLVLILMLILIPIFVILRRRYRARELAKLRVLLNWIGLGSLPVLLAALGGGLRHLQDVAWGFFLSTGITYILVSAAPLLVGIIVLAFTRPKLGNAPRESLTDGSDGEDSRWSDESVDEPT